MVAVRGDLPSRQNLREENSILILPRKKDCQRCGSTLIHKQRLTISLVDQGLEKNTIATWMTTKSGEELSGQTSQNWQVV